MVEKLEDIENEGKSVIEKEKEFGRKDFGGFCKFFLRKYFYLPSASFHEELFKICLDESKKRVAIVAPRKHAKSTIMTFALPIFKGCYGGVKNILIISATGGYAVKWLRRIKKEFETNKFIIGAFGNLRTEKWSEDDIVLSTGVEIEAKG